MERFKNFENSEEQASIEDFAGKKMTKTRLQRVLEILNIDASIVGEGSDFEIIINRPEGDQEEKEALLRGEVLNVMHYTDFEHEKILPLIRAINGSNNLNSKAHKEGSQLKIQVSRK